MRPMVVVKAGSTFPAVARRLGDFERWVERGLGPSPVPVVVADVPSGAALPDPTEVAAAVVTGSHAMVTDRESWCRSLGAWMRELVRAGTPVLGICFGHQLLAEALGGEVGYHPGGIEVGTVAVRRAAGAEEDALMAALPPTFAAHVVHRQGVRRLPPGAVTLAGNDFEPHQAFRVGSCAWGVQFHPEFGTEAMAGYVREMADTLAQEGRDVQALLDGIVPTREAASVLARFARLVEAREDAYQRRTGPVSTCTKSEPR